MIPQDIIDKINDLHIEEVVQKWGVTLKKKGASLEACCPIHGEKTPSFKVHVGKNIFKCFGCQAGGGPVSFVMQVDKVEWIEAIKRIADKFGIPIPFTDSSPEEIKEHDKRESLMVANEVAFRYFQQAYTNSGEAKAYATARWSDDSIKLFGIGWAPDDWNGLKDWATKNGVKLEILKEAGLLAESKGKLYDFFRGRLTIPVYNKYGRIVAFTGRLLQEVDGQPKYLNTPETTIYQKKSILYGIYQARSEIMKAETAFLVEGNPDVIRMHELKQGNTVSAMGTGFTLEHCSELKRMCSTVIMVSETDNAGYKSVMRNGNMLIKEGFDVFVLDLPEEFNTDGSRVKHDADSFFKTTKQLQEYRKEHTYDFIMWMAERLLNNVSVEKKQSAIDDLCHLIASTGSSSKIEYYIHNLSQVFKPKKMWRDRVKAILAETEPKEESKLPKNVNSKEFEKYGFYADHNCLHFSGKFGIQRASNFVIEPLFHVSSINAKRLFKIRNEFGAEEMVEFKQEELIALAKFRLKVEGLGNYIWEGGESELMKYKRFLYEKTDTCYEIVQLGWHKDGFWAWGNGAFTDAFVKVSPLGIFTVKGKNYYLPATSNIFDHEDQLFQFERKFVHVDTGTISFPDYARQLIKVFGDNAKIGICFYLSTLFRDLIFNAVKFFPILNIFGPKGTGKSAMAKSLMAFFVVKNNAPNINNATIPALADVVSQARNACCHLDEYKNSSDIDKIEFLKGLWDGSGRTRMNMDRDKKRETTSVDAGVILTGQEMPTADNALFSRLIFITFTQTTYTVSEANEFDKLMAIDQKGLSHITNSILTHRSKIIEGYMYSWEYVNSEINKIIAGVKVEERVFKNWTVIAATYHCLESYISLPFSSKEIIKLSAEYLMRQSVETVRSNELSTFWNIVAYLVQDGQIFNEADFRIEHLSILKTDKIDVEWSTPKTVLFINHTRIFQLYRKNGKISSDKILPINTLQYYLQNSKEYLGLKKSMAFKVMDQQTRGFSEETVTGDWGETRKAKRLNITTAYAFDYEAIGININYILESENKKITPVEDVKENELAKTELQQGDFPF
ncbi:MAG TPA: DNA primase [Williamwhitmania sp.]|nr:DNA primase [Williamwhitmania sp.]